MNSRLRTAGRFGFGLTLVGLGLSLIVGAAIAQGPAATSGMTLKATVAGATSPTDVKIDLVRWSAEQERSKIVASMSPPPNGRGGSSAEKPDVTDPFGAFGAARAPAPAAAPAAGARGRGARGARGGGDAEPAPFDPVVSLGTAIANGPTLGYLWTNEMSGYSIKYAHRVPTPDGGERIIIATNRRFSFLSPAAPAGSGPEFMVLEIRLNSKGTGEGKASLDTKVIADSEANTIALDNYASAPALLRNVKR